MPRPAKKRPAKRSGKAPVSEKEPEAKKAKVVEAKDDLAARLAALYRRCIPEDQQSPREEQLLDAEERGALTETVWPFLLAKHTQSGDHQKDLQWFLACHLLALLVTLHCREGTFPASTPLAFMTDQQSRQEKDDYEETRRRNMAVLEDALETLVHHDQKGFRFQTLMVHFILIANTCSEPSLRVCNPELMLWKWMPARRRELEFKRQPILLKKFAGVQESTEKPFLVQLISKIVHLLEGETDGRGKRLLHFYDPITDKEAEEEDSPDQVTQEEDMRDEEGPKIEKAASSDVWTFLHRSLELLIELLSNHETRQYLVVYLDSIHFSVRCRLAVGNQFASFEPLRLVQQLLQRINRFATLMPLETSINTTNSVFAAASLKSLSPTPVDIVSLHHRRATVLQKMCHRHYPHLKDVIYAGVGLLCNNHRHSATHEGNAKYVRRVLGGLKEGQLSELLHRLRLVDSSTTEDVHEERQDEFLWNVLLEYLTIPPHPWEQLKSFPLYPTESVLWDHNLIPPTHLALRSGGPVLSLPKLNKRFLSYQDYLLRNFELVRLESAYDIRADLVDVIKRLRPVVRQSMDVERQEDIVLKTEFRGWARMALELDDVVQVKRVDPPLLGNTLPAQVVAEFTIDLQPCGDSIRREWDQLAEFDNLFLVTVDASKMTGAPAPVLRDFYREQHQKPFSEKDIDQRVSDEEDNTFPKRFGVTAVRGCMVLQIRDEAGNVLSDPNFTASSEGPSKTKRIFRVALDPAQYVMDRTAGTELYAVRTSLNQSSLSACF
jgi:Intron-binding protein aquarius N-terminus